MGFELVHDVRRRPAPRSDSRALVESCFDAFARRDVDRFLESIHSRVRWRPANVSFMLADGRCREYRGHDGIRRWFRDVAALAEYSVERRGLETFGRHVVVDAEVSLRSSDGFAARAGVWYVFEVDDGKVASLTTMFDRGEAFRFAGQATGAVERGTAATGDASASSRP